MTFTEKIRKLILNNQLKEVVLEFETLISNVPADKKDAQRDVNELQTQLMTLARRVTSLENKTNAHNINQEAAEVEYNSITISYGELLSSIPSSFPDLNDYIIERDDEIAWKEAQKRNVIEPYLQYLERFPNGRYAADALKIMTDLNDIKQRQEEQLKKVAQAEKERNERETSGHAMPLSSDNTDAHKNKSGRLGIPKPLLYGLIGLIVIILIYFMIPKKPNAVAQVSIRDSIRVDTVVKHVPGEAPTAPEKPTESPSEKPSQNEFIIDPKLVKSQLEVKGHNVKKIHYKNHDGSFVGTIEYNTGLSSSSRSIWTEKNSDGSFNFQEQSRDEWSVYLIKEDGLNLQIDIFRKVVRVNNEDFYEITSYSR